MYANNRTIKHASVTLSTQHYRLDNHHVKCKGLYNDTRGKLITFKNEQSCIQITAVQTALSQICSRLFTYKAVSLFSSDNHAQKFQAACY